MGLGSQFVSLAFDRFFIKVGPLNYVVSRKTNLDFANRVNRLNRTILTIQSDSESIQCDSYQFAIPTSDSNREGHEPNRII